MKNMSTMLRGKPLTSALLGGLALLVGTLPAQAGGRQAPPMSADEALQQLKDGHERFLSGKSIHPHLTKERMAETAKGGQHPFATIISCSDSRVPVEALFDQGVGDLFVIRVAGNVSATDEIGTAEYGTAYLGTPLIMVIGHSRCGAVTAVVEGAQVEGSIPKLVGPIVPAAERAKAKGKSGADLVEEAIHENVEESMANLVKNSPVIAGLVKEGKVKIVGAEYHIEDARLDWF